MTDTLLQSLRARVIDESESLAGLLRKCLMLGAETGSDALQAWARYELQGYGADVDVPEYRLLQSPPIKVDSMSGAKWVTDQPFDRLQLPLEAREYVPERLPFRQPIDELEDLAGSSTLTFTTSGLAYAQAIWNAKLDMYQQIVAIRYALSGSTLTGILGQIRTHLVDLVAELTADTPLTELPDKTQVDAAVSHHIGTQYNTTVQAPSGPVAIGTEAKATSKGLTVADAIQLLDAVRDAASELGDADSNREKLVAVVDELRDLVEQGGDTGEVVKKAGKMRALAEHVGAPSVVAAIGGAVEAVTTLAMSGAFG
ncbi:hypothetical protein [Ruania halotolerans]|uniref:AbiTii domain-containing protein n=1 Tax=Ruania halotolerans TaxID=2897773 RepID=UPI001E4CE3B0|nr:hypothetical protein [Ruania halotolerans]UFU05496.1 hypothetical protein LQF10_13710 [Ruania halotolerans]